jgi:hypothetical protein
MALHNDKHGISVLLTVSEVYQKKVKSLFDLLSKLAAVNHRLNPISD